MLTGVTPFAGENTASVLYKQVHEKPSPLHAINPRLPSDLQPIMDRALAKNPAMRYADPTDLPVPWPKYSGGAAPTYQAHPAETNRESQLPAYWATREQALRQQRSSGERQAMMRQPAVVDSNPTPRNPPSQMIAPSRTGARWIPFVASIALLAAGTILVVSAIGLFANKASGDGGARFKAPGNWSARSQRTDNGPDISIPQALIPPVIDGDLSDWQGAQPGPFGSDDITYRKVGRDWAGQAT